MPQIKKYFSIVYNYFQKLPAAAKAFGVIIIVSGIIAPFNSASANMITMTLDFILFLISSVMYFFLIYIMGILANFTTSLLVYAANFTGFTNRPPIIEAWTVVRDLSNMFFIVVLLLIAFGTLFQVEAYSWKKLLPKMVLAAILVNFSRAICGVIVDATQIIMLTFAAAITPAASQGMVTAFQLDKLLSVRGEDAANSDVKYGPTDTAKARLLSVAAAGLMLSVMVVVQLVYVVVIVGRLVFIWFLTVLSPLAFASMVLPATEKYFREWVEMFARYATLGPMILFYLWLAMFIAAKTGGKLAEEAAGGKDKVVDLPASVQKGVASELAMTKALNTDTAIGFIISTMALAAGLELAKKNSSELGSLTSRAEAAGKWLAKAPLRYGAKPLAESAIDRTYMATGLDVNVVRQYGRVQEKRAEIKRKRELIGRAKAGDAAQKGAIVRSFLGAADFGYEQYMPVLGNQGLVKGGNRSMLGRFFYGNRNMEATRDQLKTTQTELNGATKERKEKQKTLTDGKLGNEERQQALAATQAELSDVDTLIAAADPVARNHVMDLSENSSQRGMLTSLRDDLVKKRRDKDTSETERDQLDTQIAAINVALDNGGTAELIGSDAYDPVNERLTSERERLTKERDRLQNDDTSKIEVNGQLVLARDNLHLQDLIRNALKTEDTKVKAVEDKMKDLRKKAQTYGPVVDYTKTAMQQALLSEANKQFSGEDNEDVLIDLLNSKFNEGDGIDALGVITHAASVGHLNEMMKARGHEVSAKGMQDLGSEVEKLGVSREMVLAAMNQASRSAQSINHWAFAQAVTQSNGQFDWREEDERQERIYVEASKANPSNIFRNGNRLAMGDYDKEGNWRPMQSMLALFAEAAPKMGDSAFKGMLNSNLGFHLFGGAPGDNNHQIEGLLNTLIKQIHGNNPKAIKDSGEMIDRYKSYSAKDTGMIGPLEESNKVLRQIRDNSKKKP